MLRTIKRRYAIVSLVDFAIVIIPLFFCRYFGVFPKWWQLILGAMAWVMIGWATGKLVFESFRHKRYATFWILLINLCTGFLLYIPSKYAKPEFLDDYVPYIALTIVTFLEWGFYYLYILVVRHKVPYIYEVPEVGRTAERGIDKGARIDTTAKDFEDVRVLVDKAQDKSIEEVVAYVKNHISDIPNAVFIESDRPEDILKIRKQLPRKIFLLVSLNKMPHINTMLAYANYMLDEGGCVFAFCRTSGMVRRQLKASCPIIVCDVIYLFHYLWRRVASKLSLTHGFYKWVTRGRRRDFSRTEILGRFYRSGFEVIDEDVRKGTFYIVASKIKEPIRDDSPSTGILIRLHRIGKDGKMIGVFKFRTMYSYAEYLQPYVFEHNHLQTGGKMADDYRVNLWGKIMRATWLDELPMLINWLKGDMKLVGVRPLSPHYFSLYTPEMQALRTRVKPGLVPPFYAEKEIPRTIEEVQANERRYIERYLKHPILTDWQYFWGAMKNIFLKKIRSH